MTDGTTGSGLRVALAQLAPAEGAPDVNVGRLEQVLRDHPSADLAAFPELFAAGYAAGATAESACDLGDATIERVRAAAAQARTAVIVGFTERGAAGAIHNAALCVDRDGRIAAVHRKTQLFGAAEQAAFTPGDTWTVVELAGRRIAPLICFEIEFPEPARAVVCAGAELIVSIAANMVPYGYDHDVASRARALDNRTPHAYVNRVGRAAGLTFAGGSQVLGADGHVLASAGSSETVLVRDIALDRPAEGDTDYLSQLRTNLDVLTA